MMKKDNYNINNLLFDRNIIFNYYAKENYNFILTLNISKEYLF